MNYVNINVREVSLLGHPVILPECHLESMEYVIIQAILGTNCTLYDEDVENVIQK